MTTTPEHEAIDQFFSTARTRGTSEEVTLGAGSYLEFTDALDDPKLADFRDMDYEEFAQDRYKAPFLQEQLRIWDDMYRAPFVGITSDGVVQEGLYSLPSRPTPSDPALLAAAQALLATLSDAERAACCYPLDAPERRAWSNPEFVIYKVGLRLELLTEATVDAILAVVRASLSAEGYARVHAAMALNGFLGEVVGLPKIMNDRSYWFSLYGTPSESGPWGWQLFGHHVAVNFTQAGGRQVVAPVFLGAEPELADENHTPLFAARIEKALELAGSLATEQREAAVVFESVLDPAMPEGRLHPADERHVAGAFQDNRVVPYEGINVSRLDARQQALLWEVAEDFLLLPDDQRALVMNDVVAHLGDAWFSWYGATDGSQPFYFRIQSPVILAELDHHAGVWLNNRTPERFHIHTTLRLPNGNDYGNAYLAQLNG